MLGTGLDGVDPAPLALIEIGGREQIADGENSGQRRTHLMRECRERRLDHGGFGLCGSALAPGLHRGNWRTFLRRPLLVSRVVLRERGFAAMIPLSPIGSQRMPWPG